MKSTVQGALRGTLKNAQEAIDAKAKAGRETMRKTTRDQKELIQATVDKGRNRPMLIDSYNTGTARSNAMAKL